MLAPCHVGLCCISIYYAVQNRKDLYAPLACLFWDPSLIWPIVRCAMCPILTFDPISRNKQGSYHWAVAESKKMLYWITTLHCRPAHLLPFTCFLSGNYFNDYKILILFRERSYLKEVPGWHTRWFSSISVIAFWNLSFYTASLISKKTDFNGIFFL